MRSTTSPWCMVGVAATVIVMVTVAFVALYYNEEPQPADWLIDNGDIVQVIEMDTVVNEARTKFVVKSVQTGATYGAESLYQPVAVGEYWIIEDKMVQNGHHHMGYFQFKTKINQPHDVPWRN